MGKLTDKVAVVTGASKGIGAGIAKGLAAEGASVAVNYVSSKGDADRVVSEITNKGGRAVAVQADVSKASEETLNSSSRNPSNGGPSRPIPGLSRPALHTLA